MKKLTFLLFLVGWLMACSNNTPKGIASKFLDALANRDFEKAGIYCTPSGAFIVDMARKMPVDDKIGRPSYTVLRDSVIGNEAWVFYEMAVGKEKSVTKLEMSLVNGKWKVDPKMRK